MNQDPDIAGNPPKPFPNCYWVEPGRLLAGEYPGGSSRSDPGAAVEALLHARVTCFIDLTQPKEMLPYENLLEDADVTYHRFPIVDHGIPRAPETLTAVVAAIDAALEAGRCVYVHCRAGIGRTGMAVAAYLVSGGLTPDQALERLQVLWKQNARSTSWPRSPETNQQWEYVRRWRGTGPIAAAPVSISAADRIEGAMLGLAIGDAIANVMAQSRLDATHAIADIPRRQVIETGAQTAMTVAVAESLLGRKGHDAADQLTRYLQWTKQAGAAVPPELKRALATWQWRKMLTGSHDPKNLDAHTLARTLAVVLYSIRTPRAAMDLVVDVSRVTLQSPTVLDLCRVWAAMLFDALAGTPKPILLSMQRGPQMQQLQQRILRPELDAVMRGQWQEQASGDNAPSTVAAALLALQGAKTFSSGMPRALSSSRNPAVAGSLYGAIAGAVFGVRAIPEDWRRRVHGEAALRALAQRLTTP